MGGDRNSSLSQWLPQRLYVIRGVVWCLCLIGCPIGFVPAQQPIEKNVVTIQLFVTQNSEKCQQAHECLEAFVKTRNGVAVQVAEVTTDPDALKRIWQLSKKAGLETARAPTLYLFDRVRVGFKDVATMRNELEKLFTMHVYVRRGCARCRKAKLLLADIRRRWPAIEIQYHDVVYDSGAQEKFEDAARRYGVSAAATPTFEFAGRLIVGYQNDDLTGGRIESILRSGSPATETTTEARPATEAMTASVFNIFGVGSRTTRGVWGASPGVVKIHEDGHDLVRCANSLCWAYPSAQRVRLTIDDWRLLIVEVKNAFLRKSTINNHQSQFSSAFRLPAQHNKNASTEELTRPPVPPASRFAVTQEVSSELDGESSDAIPLPVEGFEDESPDAPVSSPDRPQSITVPWFGELRVEALGMPAFTFLIGLIDGFNPCAMWVLIFLLSILVNIRSRKKIIIIAGTFVIISGLAYFAFMAAWLNVFRWVGVQRPVQITLGALGIFIGAINIKDFFAFHKGLTLSIPSAAKPGIYRKARDIVQAKYLTTAIAGAVVLAVMVNVVELLCTAGLPALYTQILTMQELPAWANYSYLALYNVAYMLDDTILLVIIVTTLSRRKLQEQEGRWLKLLSGVVVCGLGLAMVFHPDWLS